MSNSKNLAKAIFKEAIKELSRRNFWEFCIYYDKEFFDKRAFLKDIADIFQSVYDEYNNGNAIEVSVSMPPRAGKSYITSLFCAWWLGKFPHLSVMRNTCTATLYQKFSYDVRNIVKGDKFKAVFTDVCLSDDKQNLSAWNTNHSKQVGYFGSGVGGTIIGFGANLAITDDLYRGIDDALSEVYNESVFTWKQSTHDSRKEKNCPEIYIGTRWTKKDIIGLAEEKGKINKLIRIPALNEIDETFCDDVKSTKEYLKIKSEIDQNIWFAEYMQQPVEYKGLLFPESDLRTFKPDKREFETSIGYVDVADEGNDNTSSPIGRNIGTDIYITDVVFNTENSEITIPLIEKMVEDNKCKYIRVETNAMGAIYKRNLEKRLYNCDVYGATSTTNKHTRILMDSGFIKKHCLFLAPEFRGEDYKKFMMELTSYLKNGTSKRDDSPDSLSGLVIFIRSILGSIYD